MLPIFSVYKMNSSPTNWINLYFSLYYLERSKEVTTVRISGSNYYMVQLLQNQLSRRASEKCILFVK